MDWSGAIIPAQEPPPPPPEPRLNKKVWIALGVVFVLTVVSLAAWKILENRAKFHVTPIQEVTTAELATEGHQSFFANLEYDPTTGVVTQHERGVLEEDAPPLLDNLPPVVPSEFVYKLEVVSEADEVLQTGWKSTPKEIITTPEGALRFIAVSVYKKSASLHVSLPDGGIIWTGKMQ